MKKRTLRIVSLVLALMLLVSAFAACGNEESGGSSAASSAAESSEAAASEAGETSETGETSEAENELVAQYPAFAEHHELDITWYEQGWTGIEEDKDIIGPKIEEITNLKLGYEAMTVPTADDYTQQLNLMIAGGEIPDAFFGSIDAYTREIYQKLGESGQIWDLTGMVTEEEYPNLYALIHPEMELYATENDQIWFFAHPDRARL